MLITLFIITQVILILIMALHDWVHIPPLTNIKDLETEHSIKFRVVTSLINTFMIVVPFILTILYMPGSWPCWATITMVTFYTLLTIGTIMAWWIPYICGSSAKHKAGFAEYKNTHHFLPARGDNVIPNTFHCIMHALVWCCLGIAIYLLMTSCG